MSRGDRVVVGIVLLAMVVSVVHYVDNYSAYADYPRSESIPNPSQGLIGGAWFFFTAFALAGLALLRAGRRTAAGVCLAVYSGSGLVGIGHYAVGGTSVFPWWRHAHVIADIALGFAVLACALWLVRAERPARAGAQAPAGR